MTFKVIKRKAERGTVLCLSLASSSRPSHWQQQKAPASLRFRPGQRGMKTRRAAGTRESIPSVDLPFPLLEWFEITRKRCLARRMQEEVVISSAGAVSGLLPPKR
ncbi:hypothetical protein KY290_013906 [Solanum tuberosum]|uniref:Uncharacterized protein n=1 Tax=Solanum tuberosum TaxID=4113 RepID=A0ABQ7VNT4_SOLTU|nr:hypothetical protein KY289_014020 [Solanum tuberosum]KAH0696539.1 hypothetical protein KY289_014021 [Solanum tuberosum]KAH0700023.1 hypothetical protein KY284_014238 [Solanum tuberosum]KAH0717294.1 hypothetical protein KY285_013325 [Solanum tuberosum]KAH0717295.1 hypothetical protein KY285_013326 [Solanum tuberosum]